MSQRIPTGTIAEHSRRLAELLPQLEKRKPVPINEKVKFFLSGTMCEDTSVEILDFVEELGGVIVDDDLYMGYRYVAVDCEDAPKPIESLHQRYLNMVPCPTRYMPEGRDYGGYLVSGIPDSRPILGTTKGGKVSLIVWTSTVF